MKPVLNGAYSSAASSRLRSSTTTNVALTRGSSAHTTARLGASGRYPSWLMRMVTPLVACGVGPPRPGGLQDTPTASRSSQPTRLRPRAFRRGRPGSIEIETDQPQRIERDAAVGGEPVEVRAGHAPRCADLADRLAARHRVADRDQRATEMQIPGDEPRAVIDENGGAAQIQVGDQGDHPAIGRPYARAAPTGEVDAHVTAAQHAVEHARHAEPISYRARPGADERLDPKPRSVVCLVPHASHQLPFFLDPLLERDRGSAKLGRRSQLLARRPPPPGHEPGDHGISQSTGSVKRRTGPEPVRPA